MSSEKDITTKVHVTITAQKSPSIYIFGIIISFERWKYNPFCWNFAATSLSEMLLIDLDIHINACLKNKKTNFFEN